jgi:hypothetical protein
LHDVLQSRSSSFCVQRPTTARHRFSTLYLTDSTARRRLPLCNGTYVQLWVLCFFFGLLVSNIAQQTRHSTTSGALVQSIVEILSRQRRSGWRTFPPQRATICIRFERCRRRSPHRHQSKTAVGLQNTPYPLSHSLSLRQSLVLHQSTSTSSVLA